MTYSLVKLGPMDIDWGAAYGVGAMLYHTH